MPKSLNILQQERRKAVPKASVGQKARKPKRKAGQSDLEPQETSKKGRRSSETPVEPSVTSQDPPAQPCTSQPELVSNEVQVRDDTSSQKPWGCHSVVDRQAAAALGKLLKAKIHKRRGLSLKSLTLAPHIKEKKATYKVTLHTVRHLGIIRRIVSESQLLTLYPRLPATLAYVLCFELLYGEGLKPHGPAERALLSNRDRLAGLKDRLAAATGCGATDVPQELASQHSRAARVNTLKLSVTAALKQLRSEKNADGASLHLDVRRDELLPDVLLFPPGTDLHDHELVKQGSLILQSRASCMPAHALAAKTGWFILDACAAPGNKTTHLAALTGGKSRILALDRDPARLKRLRANLAVRGCRGVTSRCQDFLETDPKDAELSGVQAILLDPSCSGSGTAQSRIDELLSDAPAGQETSKALGKRLKALSTFQTAALRHAFTFPALRRLVYSTCSIHAEENEHVIQAVLPDAEAAGFRLEDPFPGWHRRGLPLVQHSEKLVRVDAGEDGTDGFFVALFAKPDNA